VNRRSIDTIYNRVKQNFPSEDVICEVCETDLCNGSSRHKNTRLVLYLLPLSFIIMRIAAQVT
jgi:hypothetical protein